MIRGIHIILMLILSSLSAIGMKAEDLPPGDLNFLASYFDKKDAAYRGFPLRIVRNNSGEINRIGYHIFDDGVLSAHPDSTVLQFVERYLLLLDVIEPKESAVQRMADDHVWFLKGAMSDFFKVMNGNVEISIEKRYSSHKREILLFLTSAEKNVNIAMSFPPSYELILGHTRRELEETFPEILLGYDSSLTDEIVTPDLEEMTPDILASSHYNTYQHERLNDRCYFSRNDSGNLSAVFSNSNPEESAANLFMGYAGNDRLVNLNQKLYGFKETGVTTSVAQLINYCRGNGMNMYFGVEKTFDDHILALVTAVHPDLMYLHLLSVEIPLDIAENSHAVINGKISTFIPTHNLKTLYQEQEY